MSGMQVLRFSFTLPPRERMAELGKLMSVAMHFIDVVGMYKLKPEQRLRAEKLRKEVAAMEWRKQDDKRRESAEERRAAKRREELVREQPHLPVVPAVMKVHVRFLMCPAAGSQEKLKRMTPAAREKHEARMSRLDRQRQMKSRVKVM